jgi:hypothetical protein
MRRVAILLSFFSIFLAACQVLYPTTAPSATVTPDAAITSLSTAGPTTSPARTVQVSATTPSIATPIPTPRIRPVIHDTPGEFYTSVFTFPVGGKSPLQYWFGTDLTDGPNTFAVLPDGTFFIGDLRSNQIYHFDRKGKLLDTIDLDKLDIHSVIDIRVKNDQLFLVEANYNRVRRLTLEGRLLSTEFFPGDYRIGFKNVTIEVLSGIAIDCQENIILEIASRLFHLKNVQLGHNPVIADRGLICGGRQYKYQIEPPRLQIIDDHGDLIFCSSKDLKDFPVALSYLDVFPDGSIYIVGFDLQVVGDDPNGDMAVHFLNLHSPIQGVARFPAYEEYYHPNRSLAIGPQGEVYGLVIRHDFIEVVRLNFYKQLEPLGPKFAAPNITCTNSP